MEQTATDTNIDTHALMVVKLALSSMTLESMRGCSISPTGAWSLAKAVPLERKRFQMTLDRLALSFPALAALTHAHTLSLFVPT